MSKKYKHKDGVDVWVDHYSEMGKTELSVIMKRYTPESDEYHAAAILIDNIDERQEKKEDKKHKDLTFIAKLTLFVSVMAAVAAGFAAYYAKSQAESSLQSAQIALQNTMQQNKK